MAKEKSRSNGADAPLKWKVSVAALAIICCMVLSVFLSLDGTNDDNATFASSFHKPMYEVSADAERRVSDISQKESSAFRMANGSFPGAREWYDHWTYASRKGNDRYLLDKQSHIHDDYVVSSAKAASHATLEHLSAMKRRYKKVGALPDFYARGLGWIYDRLGMALTVIVAGNFTSNTIAGRADMMSLHPGPTSIFIVDTLGDMKCGGKEDTWIERQPPLTMWVRAEGQEIFAGTALPHKLESSAHQENQRCAWKYDFEPNRPGPYSIHVKVLNFQGFDTVRERCEMEPIPSRNAKFDNQAGDKAIEGDLLTLEAMNFEAVQELAEEGNYSHHRGISGFKIYDPKDACCEACTRARNCKMWTFPGALHFDECELYFDQIEDDVDFLDREDGQYLGRDRGYSYTTQSPQSFPYIRRKLKLQHGRKLVINSGELTKGFWPIKQRPMKGFPRRGAVTYYIGCGWSSMMSFESPCHYPTDDLIFGSGKNTIEIVGNSQHAEYSSAVNDASRSCALADERLDISKGRWVRYQYPDNSVCLPIVDDNEGGDFKTFRPMYRGDQPPHCWHRDDLTKIGNICAEPGCQFLMNHRWVTDLKRENKWYGFWENYNCQNIDFWESQIQNCIDVKKISSIQLEGHSVRGIVNSYMAQRLRNITMTTPGNNTLSVVISTLSMSHKMWHQSVDEFREELEELYPNVTSDGKDHYWISGFYLTSEREPHVQVDRSLYYSKVAWDTLTLRGYKMINGFDVTAAFAYDTDGQADGLHVNGPPIRAIITKFFHHLCHDVLTPES